MFGNLGAMKEQQEELQNKLKEERFIVEAEGGQIKIEMNAAKELVNISIAQSFMDDHDAEGLEDILLVSFNRAIEQASMREQEIAQSALKDMLPPGFENLLG
jgi:DNA-binding YbaB/EbfC family protein